MLKAWGLRLCATPEKIILYGPIANGTVPPYSDMDIVVVLRVLSTYSHAFYGEPRSCLVELIEERVKEEKARDRAQHLARTDDLSDLLNRRAFMERLELEVELAQTEGLPLSIILIDLDSFKNINDNLFRSLQEIQ